MAGMGSVKQEDRWKEEREAYEKKIIDLQNELYRVNHELQIHIDQEEYDEDFDFQ